MESKNTPIYKRVKIGRPAKFPTAEDLWREALAYFDWCDENPITTTNKRKKVAQRKKRRRADHRTRASFKTLHPRRPLPLVQHPDPVGNVQTRLRTTC